MQFYLIILYSLGFKILAKVHCKLKNPFPVELLYKVELGSMDGHRDLLIEDTFIDTRKVQTFREDKHSVIIGSFGAGKSAIFSLLKNKSDIFPEYQNDLIVPIDEQLQFSQLKKDSYSLFSHLDKNESFQLIWKFQVCRRVAEEIAKLDNFGKDENEEYLNVFLDRTGGLGSNISILQRLKDLAGKISLKINAKLSGVPIEAELTKKDTKIKNQVEINLDELIERSTKAIKDRGFRKATIIIDKLDKFVAKEEYQIQRIYLESLLQLEDDLYGYDSIGFKIFMRSDLYDRLDFSALGPDKAEDNTLRLQWGHDEIRRFIARRFFLSYEKAEIWTGKDLWNSSDISEFSLKWYEKALLKDSSSSFLYKVSHFWKAKFGRKITQSTLVERIDLIIIHKLFPKHIIHECGNGNKSEITTKEFFETHFLDGNNSCTPRYILVFLKELLEKTKYFYSDSPNLVLSPVQNNKDWVYNLFTPELVYGSYVDAKEKYIRHVSKVDEKWALKINELLSKKKGKTTFNLKWIKDNLTFEKSKKDQEAKAFLIYLKVIGFLKEIKYDVDVKKREFEIPILYKQEKNNILKQ